LPATEGIQQFSDPLGGAYASSFLATVVAVVVARAIYPKFGPPPLLTLNLCFASSVWVG